MQVTETLSDGLRRGFAVVVPAADIESRRAKRLAELGRDLNLPGFRPGKVPANLVRKRFGGAVTAEVLEASVDEATKQVLADRGLRTAGQPKVELTQIEEARDLEFKVELELLPDISLPDFAALRLTRFRTEPPPDAIDRALGELARRQRSLEDVGEDRPAEPGDIVSLDFTGSVDGAEFPGGSGSDMDVEVGGGGFLPGFTDQLAGLRAGESRTLHLEFPADYGVGDLAGKAATFEVTAKALKRQVIPDVNEALAEKIGFDSLDEVRQLLTRQMQREYDQLARLRIKRQLLDALAAQADFPVPQGMVDAEYDQIWQRLEQDRKEGRLDAEDQAKDESALKAEYRAIAERRVRLGLLLSEVGRTNGITVAPDELTRAMRAEAARYPGQEQKVMEFFRKTPQAVDGLRGPIFEDKVIDYIVELAEVEDRTVTPEELGRDPDAGATGPGGATNAGVAGAADSIAAEPGQVAGSEREG